MSLDEFRAFGHLRSGIELQWANILCQMFIPSLDLNKPPTYTLIMQACLEAGPPNGSESFARAAHSDTQDIAFIPRMLSAMVDALERIRESWQNDVSMALLTRLAARLLTLAPSESSSVGVLQYLAEIRQISINWARKLLDEHEKTESGADRLVWARRLHMASLICSSTFDVRKHLRSVLSDPENLLMFVESAVLARDYLPGRTTCVEVIPRLLLHRCQELLYLAQGTIKEQIIDFRNPGLDTAIKRFWSDYAPGPGGWQAQLDTRAHILASVTGPSPCNSSNVTFNILTAGLFVNGNPLSKLPCEYQEHPTYVQLFGRQVLTVMPSHVNGMSFSCPQAQMGWVVHFAMADDELIVQAIRHTPGVGDSIAARNQGLLVETWEYNPPESSR